MLALHGLLHLLGYDHETDDGRMGGSKRGCGARAASDGPDRTRGGAMIASLAVLVLLALAAIYVGTIEAAFSALMRLSLRLMAERNGRAGGLGAVPRRSRCCCSSRSACCMGLIVTVATVLLAPPARRRARARASGRSCSRWRSSSSSSSTCCRCSIVRQRPGARARLPAAVVRRRSRGCLQPITRALVGLIATLRASAQPQRRRRRGGG